MLNHRPAAARGHFDHGWLNTFHTFSFAGYLDPAHMGFRSLRVMNEDRVAAGRGFGEHAHDNMEILSLVLGGQLEHRDSMGNGSILTPGEVQYMSAGSGVRHSEFNPSPTEPVHFYQVWIVPDETGATPRYGQTTLDLKQPGVQPIAGDGAAIELRENAAVSFLRVDAGETLVVPRSRPHQWVQVLAGSGEVVAGDARQPVGEGDGVALSDEPQATLAAGSEPLTALVFDLS